MLGLRVRDLPKALRCVLEQDTLSSAKYLFNPGDVPTRLKKMLTGT